MTDEKYIVTKIEKVSNTRDRFYIQPIDSPRTNWGCSHTNNFEAPHNSFELGDSVQPFYQNDCITGARKLTYNCRVRARIIDATGNQITAFCEEYGDIAITLKVGVPRPARGDDVILRNRDNSPYYEILENITLMELRKSFLVHKQCPNFISKDTAEKRR